MEASALIAARFLAAFEQAAQAELPAGWERPQAEPTRRREAAAVLLAASGLASRGEMKAFFDRVAGQVAERAAAKRRRPGEDGAAEEPDGDRGTALWRELATLLERISRTQPRADPSLFTLEVCARQSWIRALARALAAAAAPPPAASEEMLTALARILLRAKARRFTLEDRRRERGAEA
jgi:hypothetical protein